MRIKYLVLVILLTASSAFTLEHPLKMSFSNMMINDEGTVLVEARIFLDDITEHMQYLYGMEEPDFSSSTSDGSRGLQTYLNKHFYLKQGDKQVFFQINALYLSKNKLAMVVRMKSLENLDATKEIVVTNTLLCDADEKQVNNVRYLGKQYELSHTNPEVTLTSFQSKQ